MILFSMSSTILSELVFAAIEETEDYWAFIKAKEEGRHQAKVCRNHEFKPGGATGGSWDQIWSSGPS